MSRAVTEKEFKEWLEHPVTIAIKKVLEAKRDLLRRQWESGHFTDYDMSSMALVNVGNIGTCRGYAFVQELDYEGYTTEIDDEERKRARTPGSSGTGKDV